MNATCLRRRLIIMPAHNEVENLPRVLPEMRGAAPGFDLLVVDDGSNDRTAAVAGELGATVVSLPVNLGYGAAVQTGFRYAVMHGYDLGVVMDADGQHDPASILALVGAVESDGAEVAVGSRFRGRDFPKRFHRRLAVFDHFPAGVESRGSRIDQVQETSRRGPGKVVAGYAPDRCGAPIGPQVGKYLRGIRKQMAEQHSDSVQ